MLAKALTCAVVGLDGQLIEVEAYIPSHCMPNFIIVGLPDAAVQETSRLPWEQVSAVQYSVLLATRER